MKTNAENVRSKDMLRIKFLQSVINKLVLV